MGLHTFTLPVTILMAVLWAYAATTKLFDMKRFNHAMMTQVFPRWAGKIFLYLIPLLEMALVILLFIPKTRLIAMYSSLFLMILFTLYVGGAVYHVYERYPCACGGIFARMGWYKHFQINIMFTLIAFIGVILMEL